MNKPPNETIERAAFYGTQLRYVTRRRLRKILRKYPGVQWRHAFGPFYSWLRPL